LFLCGAAGPLLNYIVKAASKQFGTTRMPMLLLLDLLKRANLLFERIFAGALPVDANFTLFSQIGDADPLGD